MDIADLTKFERLAHGFSEREYADPERYAARRARVAVATGPTLAAGALTKNEGEMFVLCPLGCLPAMPPQQMAWQQALYQWAFGQAQAVVSPYLPERDLLAVWN